MHKKDTSILYIVSIIFVFLLNLFVFKITSRIVLMLIILVFLLIGTFIFKYRSDNLYSKKSVMLTMTLIAFIQVVLYYSTGLFEGYSINAVKLNFKNLFLIILPIIISLIGVELIRYLISKKYEKSNIFEHLSTIMFILIDISLFYPFPNFSNLENLLEFLGITLFPSIVYNFVFNKLTILYGYRPILFYRIIIMLSYYIIPVVPKMYVLFRAIARIIIPLIIFLIISYMYDRVEFENVFVKKKEFNISSIICIVIVIIFAGLISCKFKYGMLTVGSQSMSGTVEVGDVVLFEKYNNQNINIGDIIIFKMGNRNIIHRVIEVIIFNDDYIYVTKGDSNKYKDPNYRYKKDILGIVRAKIKYLGFPSIWLNNLFN